MSLKTLPFSGLVSIDLPYLCSHWIADSRNWAHPSLVLMPVTCKNMLLSSWPIAVLGYLRHHISPCLWICTRHLWIMTSGHNAFKTRIAWGLPSTVQLTGLSPLAIKGLKKERNCLSDFSLTPYWPAIIWFLLASITVTMLTGLCEKVPSNIK